MKDVINRLISLFEYRFKVKPESVKPLPGSGSSRRYFRMVHNELSVIGAYNEIYTENLAFIKFTEHFLKHGCPVPQILAENLEENIYIISDLGNTTLLDIVLQHHTVENFPESLLKIYKKVIEDLIHFQVVAGKDLDFSVCWSRKIFNDRAMLWDLEYFKYYFLKPSGFNFNEVTLQDDFQTLVSFLSQAEAKYFMYRDFQTRNILIIENNPYYIDYQGGHKGALQYDLASLLFQAKADLPEEVREELLDHYLDILHKNISFDRRSFVEHYWGFVLIRLIQVLGAYGFRGMFEGKIHFLQSIPLALKNVKWFLNRGEMMINLPELCRILENIIVSDKFTFQDKKVAGLNITINSFSYRKRIPGDLSGNGGGFVFDCRALPNPFRIEELRFYSGKDEEIVDFLKDKTEVETFMQDVFSLVSQSIDDYLKRGFTDLMINFGCTGGQHRSVYCAEKLADHLNKNWNIHVSLNHMEVKNWLLK